MTNSAAGSRVRFVVVPFLPAYQPALGVSSLLSVLRDHGIEGDVRYLNLEYGRRVGWDFYEYLTGQTPSWCLLGETLFARALWGENAPAFEQYAERIERILDQLFAGTPGGDSFTSAWARHRETMRTAIEEAPRVVAAWADAVLAGSPRVLGFTSTFQQNVAALALAQEVRRRVPPQEVAIVFGGANCEDEMGRALADNFNFIDCVVSGEAEAVIIGLVRGILDGDGRGFPPRFLQGTMVRDMDALPLPSFDDYFADLQGTPFEEQRWLAAESSRGCWWGTKSHCTFCGLNGGTMAFRSKSGPRFAAELETLSRKHGTTRFALTDNILDMSYLRTLLPELVAKGRKYHLFYETKSNLRKDQVELLAAAGVAALQPGIESFSTPILKLMGKGTSRLQNVQLLKWCAELGVTVSWNFLYGFPGEEPAEYRDMTDLLPALFHLPPPMRSSFVRLDRFGPYWKSPERYGLSNVRHYWSYDFAFAGLPERERSRLAYFFEYEHADGTDPLEYARPLNDLADEWRETAGRKRLRLELRASAAGPVVFDTRPCRWEEIFALTPSGLALVRALDGFRSRDSLLEAVCEQGVEISEAECESLLAELVARRFIIEENGYYLSLIVDPKQRVRVAERQVALRLERFGLRWPDDFPDPQKRQVVRAAMLSLGAGAAPPGASANSTLQ